MTHSWQGSRAADQQSSFSFTNTRKPCLSKIPRVVHLSLNSELESLVYFHILQRVCFLQVPFQLAICCTSSSPNSVSNFQSAW